MSTQARISGNADRPRINREHGTYASPGSTEQSLPAWLPKAIVAVTAGLFLLALYRHRAYLPDDTLISLRFARHFDEHGVLEWNLGERVEGYTNFLHVILTSIPIRFGLDPIVSARGINALAALGLALAAWQGLRILLPARDDGVLRATGLLLVAGTPSIGLWVFGGLETLLAAALLTGGVALLLPALVEESEARPRPVLAGALLAAAVLTRPDSALVAGLFLAMVLLLAPGSLNARLRLVLVSGLALALPVLVHLAWRYSYYGDFVPNTFHTKVGVPVWLRLQNGLLYLGRSHLMLPTLAGSAALLALAWRARVLPRVAWALLVPVAAHVAYAVWAGGDHMAGARLLVPVVGLAAFLAVVLLKAHEEPIRRWGTAALAASVVFVSLAFAGQGTDEPTFDGRLIGAHLTRTEKPGTLVAAATAGSIPYYADHLRYIDTLGLVDAHIARRRDIPLLTHLQMTLPGHTKGDGAYVLSRKPHIIILGTAAGVDAASQGHFLSDREMVALPEFARCYRMERVELPYETSFWWQRRQVASPLIFTYYRRHCPDCRVSRRSFTSGCSQNRA